MNKLKISRINPKVHKFKGFNDIGCYGCQCKDACCRYGADIDKETYDLIFKYRKLIEKEIGVILEDCFEKKWTPQNDYLGGKCIRSKTSKRYCVFHLPKGKGCVLYFLHHKNKLSRRIIPSICRLYPLTWNKEEIKLVNGIESTCNCLEKCNMTMKSVYATQNKDVEDIFDIRL